MKNKKVSLKVYIFSMIIMAVLAGGLVYWGSSRESFVASNASNDDLKKVHALYDDIKENYYKDVDNDKLIEGALQGMTDSLDDPYTTYLGQQDAADFNSSLSSEFEGIGATLTLVDKQPEVVEAPIKGSPAEKAGLQAKDKIIKVDGKKTAGKDLNDVVSKIRGKKGTTVKLVIEREDETFNVSIKRDKIPLASLEYQLDKDNKKVGSIEIASFNENTAEELQKAIKALRKKGATSFVIDLRGNPGGYLDQVEEMASMFLKDGKTIVKFGKGDEVLAKTTASKDLDGGFKVSEPTAVIVDKNSASAAEIFAAALKESANIPIIGTRTFGKGTVQTVNEFGDQSEVKMTVQKWLTPKGEWINEKGVKPTIKADFPAYAYLPPLDQTQTLQKGDASDNVKNLNTFLKALGYQTKGQSFNDTTASAIKDFQQKNDLKQTAKADKATISAIEKAILEKLQKNDPMYQKAIDELTK